MGRIINSSETTPSIHFSHPHPLTLINHQQTLTLTLPSCSGCHLTPSGMIYSCTTCNFFLHKKCFEMPKKITHPCHNDHPLTLLPKPDYPNGLFKCDGCGETGRGFSYNCKPCGVDLHTLCAIMPLSVTHASHAHKLDLTFEPPYGTQDFCCDICKRNGLNHWLYRCGSCGFDAHLSCARSSVQHNHANNFSGPGTTSSRSCPPPQMGPQMGYQSFQQNMMHNPMMMNNVAAGVPAGVGPFMGPFGVHGRNNAMDMQAVMQLVNSNNAMTQALLAGGGGGLGGGDRGVQQVMQLISGLNRGGGGISGLMGGNGLDLLGGNGLDLLGGGGLDFLGGLL